MSAVNTSQKLVAGSEFPKMEVALLNGGTADLSTPANGLDWRLVVIYRGKHCPICTRYLRELNGLLPKFNEIGIDVIAVSCDSKARAETQIAEVEPDFPVGYDLSIDQALELGLYVSHPRSAKESDRPFAEPGLFLVNADGKVQVLDISNAPFARPDLNSLLMGAGFIRNPENNYPIRGTFAPGDQPSAQQETVPA